MHDLVQQLLAQLTADPQVLSAEDRACLMAALHAGAMVGGEPDPARLLELEALARRQQHELALLEQVRLQLYEKRDAAAIASDVVARLPELFNYRFVSMYLLENDRLVLQDPHRFPGFFPALGLERGVMARVVRTGQPIFVPNVADEPEFIGIIPNLQSEVAVPLYVDEHVVGVLNVETEAPHVLTEADFTLIQAIGQEISIAMKRGQLFHALKAAESRYTDLLNTISQIIYQADDQGRLVFVNSAFERVLGIPIADALGERMVSWAHPDDMAIAIAHRDRMRATREPVHTPALRVRTADGSTRWIELTSTAQFDDAGRFIGSTGLVADITEQYVAQQRETEHRRLAEALARTAATLARTLDTDEMLRELDAAIQRALPPFDALAAFLLDNDQVLHLRHFTANRDVPGLEALADWHIDLATHTLWADALRNGPAHRLAIDDLPHDSIPAPLAWAQQIVIAPLRTPDAVFGGLCLFFSSAQAVVPAHIERLGAFAAQAAMALHNAQLYNAVSVYAQQLEHRVNERTQQYRLAKEQAEAILNASSDAILLLDAQAEIRRANRAYFAMLHLADDASVPLRQVFANDQAASQFQQTFEQVTRERTGQRLELAFQRTDSSTFIADVYLDPVSGEDETVGAVCSMRDITERRQMEDDLRAALEREQYLVQLRSQFGAIMSHEFRTPLSVIQTSTDLLKHYHERLSPPRRAEIIRTIESQIKSMLALINDILMLSRAEAIEEVLYIEPTEIVSFIADVIAEMQLYAERTHSIVFMHDSTCAEPDTVYPIDRALMRRALQNLLTNAVKYSPGANQIEVNLHCDDDIVISVRDYGIGIPLEDQQHLFEMFYRADNVGSIAGTGLGLAIVRQAVDAHRGRISVASAPNIGTTFTIRLPAPRQA
jgi:PAS domain S-box-containing protein